MASVSIASFGLQNGTDRTIFITWTWNKADTTEEYRVYWSYDTGNGVAFVGEDTTTSYQQSTYTAPDNAIRVMVKVLPVSKTYKKNGTDVSYWSADWSTLKSYEFDNVVIKTVPSVNSATQITIAQQAGTERTLYATWVWTQGVTATYEVQWDYYTGDPMWYEGSRSTVDYRDTTYSVPDNATRARFRVKPVAQTHIVDGQEVAYWTTEWSEWSYFDTSAFEPEISSVPEVNDVTIGQQTGADRTMYATWDWSQSHTEGYDVEWDYNTGDPTWYEGSRDTVTYRNATYSVPSNAIRIRCRVKPVSETHTVNGQEVVYWRTGWSGWETLDMSDLDPSVPQVDGISSLSIDHQADTDRTMYVTWDWSQSHTEGYDLEWAYTTAGSGIWFEGTTATVTYRNATYSVPSNAIRIRCRVKPVSETHTVNGQEVAYWSTVWSAWAVFDMRDLEPVVPEVESISKVVIGQQTGADRTMYATWDWSQSHTEGYDVEWDYNTGDPTWYEGSRDTVTYRNATYSVPSNAIRIQCRVKPVSETHTVNGQEVAYWSTVWSAWAVFDMSDIRPSIPSVPTVSVNGSNLTAEVDSYGSTATEIEFRVVKNNISKFAVGKAPITENHASYTCVVSTGGEYKVCCRGVRGSVVSDWSEYSSNVGTVPATPAQFTQIVAMSATSVQLKWVAVQNAESYVIEYTNQKRYFDTSPDNVKTTTIAGDITQAEITGLDSGETWYFRLKATNEHGDSGWNGSGYAITIGESPAAPTTWTLSSTVIVGEDVTLYWVHNSRDNSRQSAAELELTIAGSTSVTTITNSEREDDAEEVGSYVVHTDEYPEGASIDWRVRTMGAIQEYGEWSVRRTVSVYAPATLEFTVGSGDIPDILSSFPLVVSLDAGPATQKAMRFSVSIVSNDTYETMGNDGVSKWVSKGDEVYSGLFEGTDGSNSLVATISANKVSLVNNADYTIICAVAMDSGLSASCSANFNVQWDNTIMEPNAELSVDTLSLVAYITPYCEDNNGKRISGVLLSVYRRNFDGSFTEIASGLPSSANTTVTDPHPALDYARYRVIATSIETGELAYYDMPGYPIKESDIVIQWDENWSSFDIDDENPMVEPAWSGSMLRLAYNIDVSNDNDPDVSLVKYIGRSHPVSYYGTQRGEKATWNVEIPKDDKETLYTLRRLAAYPGDAYVREPSGSGYWAQVAVSFSQKYNELTIPVTISITRVEGGA